MVPPVKNFRAIQPVVVGIRERAVAEDVHEEPAVRLQEPRPMRPRSAS